MGVCLIMIKVGRISPLFNYHTHTHKHSRFTEQTITISVTEGESYKVYTSGHAVEVSEAIPWTYFHLWLISGSFIAVTPYLIQPIASLTWLIGTTCGLSSLILTHCPHCFAYTIILYTFTYALHSICPLFSIYIIFLS